jgi:subtilisin family serine protease
VSTGAGVTIGIVDTGIDLAHHELGPKVVPGGAATCINTNGNPNACTTGPGAGQDDEGHGSFVAGEAAAATNDGYQIAAVAPDARLVVAKALDATGGGTISDINAGIEWVIAHGAQVVNLSLGPEVILGGGGQAFAPGLEWAWSHGVVPVIASGNTNVLHVLGSSGYGNIDAVVVGATARSGQEASYSSPLTGTKWAILAPGGDGRDAAGQASCSPPTSSDDCVISTYWQAGHSDSTAFAQGTSMATPIVAGVVAQLLGMGLSKDQAVSTVLSTAVKKQSCGCAGEVDAAAAVRSALSQGGHPDLVASAPVPPAAASPSSHAVTAARGPGVAARSGQAGAPSYALPGSTLPAAPSVAVPSTPGPVAIGAGGTSGASQTAASPTKPHSGDGAMTAVGALGVVLLLAVIAAAVRFRLWEPSARYPSH